jgi:hypothetical protein
VVESSFSGCVWKLQYGDWSSVIPKMPGSPVGKVSVIRFESQAGLKFDHREMTPEEAGKFQDNHPGNAGRLSGDVDAIDMSLVRLVS